MVLFCFSSYLVIGQTATVADSLYPKPTQKIKYHNAWTSKEYPRRINQFKEKPLQEGDIVFFRQ